MDVSTVRWWAVCFSSGNSNVKPRHVLAGHEDFHKHNMHLLVHLWQKCITNGNDYVEKWCFVAESLLYQIVSLCF